MRTYTHVYKSGYIQSKMLVSDVLMSLPPYVCRSASHPNMRAKLGGGLFAWDAVINEKIVSSNPIWAHWQTASHGRKYFPVR